MATITITLTDLPHVTTDAKKPTIGEGVTPAEALAMELLGTTFKRGACVVYDAYQVPAIALALELLDPEGLGFTVPAAVRDRARHALGRPPVALKPAMDGVDIDRVHALRQVGGI